MTNINRTPLIRLADINPHAMPVVEESLTSGYAAVIGAIMPVATGFGDRYLVFGEIDEGDPRADPGLMLDLTYEQLVDLHEKLGKRIQEISNEDS